MLTSSDKADIRKIVIDAIQEVIIPAMDLMEQSLSKRIDSLEVRINRLEDRVSQMDRKLDHVLDKVLDHNEKLKNYEKRISKVEQFATIS